MSYRKRVYIEEVPRISIGKNYGAAEALIANKGGIKMTINEAKKKNNPWAICTASVGRDDKDKYEACVMDVKKKMGVSESITEAEYCGVEEDELTEALATSGFSAAEVILAKEKLVSIQKNMIESVKLESEFPDSAIRKINKKISYIPEGPNLIMDLKNGHHYSIPTRGDRLEKGILKSGGGDIIRFEDLD